MVLVTVALVSLYSLVLPFISLYLLKEYDTYHYEQLKVYYDGYVVPLLPGGSSEFPQASSPLDLSGNVTWTDSLKLLLIRFWKNSAVYALYVKVSTSDKVWEICHKAQVQLTPHYNKLQVQLTPFYHSQIVPALRALDKFKLEALLFLRPYYLSAIEFVVPRAKFLKDAYISYYNDAINFVQPYYKTFVDDTYEPFRQQYIGPALDFLTESYYEYVHPFYLDHQSQFTTAGQGLINFIIGVLIYKLFEKQITSILEIVLSDIYDVNQGLAKNYQTDVPESAMDQSLIGNLSESEREPVLDAVRKIDAMRPLDNIVDHETDFTGILNSRNTSFDDTTKVETQARHPYSQDKKPIKSIKKKSGGGQPKKGQQNKKDVNGSFLDDSLAIGILGVNDSGAHVGAQVQVQVVNENNVIEIQEEIEDELASKGKPNGVLDDEEEEETSEEEETTGEEPQNTEDMIKRKLNSVSDSSSDFEEKPPPQLPRVLTDFSTPTKYNTGIFFSSSKNAIITAAIPLTPSPTKPAFGVLLEEAVKEEEDVSSEGPVVDIPEKDREKSPVTSIISSSSVISKIENDYSLLSFKESSFISNLSPSKPSKAKVNEDTVYVTNGEAESAIKKAGSFPFLGDLNMK